MDYFQDYQEIVKSMSADRQGLDKMTPGDTEKALGLAAATLGLTGATGDLASKVQKLVNGNTSLDNYFSRAALALDLGDVLRYVAILATALEYQMSDVARLNVERLAAVEDNVEANRTQVDER